MAAALVSAGPITFSLNNTVGAGSISGTIATDGFLGVLGTSNILDWDLTLSDGTTSFTLLGPLSGNNSQVVVVGTDLSETATQLLFNFSGSGYVLFQNPTIGSAINYFCVEAQTGCTGSPAGESLRRTAGLNQFTAFSGSQAINSDLISTVPEPSGFVLLTFGAAALLTLRRRAGSSTH
jgi:hypothetical protein